jgi:acyl-CoA hydrolase
VSLPPKSPAESRTTMTEYVLPTHANALGNVFGGQILAWMDICAAICAQRHAGTIAVTAGIDDLAFELPIKVGQVVKLEARITAAFRTSVEVEVIVEGEDAMTGQTWPCVRAFLTFVALDRAGARCEVPGLSLANDAERTREAEASERRAYRLSRRPTAPRG